MIYLGDNPGGGPNVTIHSQDKTLQLVSSGSIASGTWGVVNTMSVIQDTSIFQLKSATYPDNLVFINGMDGSILLGDNAGDKNLTNINIMDDVKSISLYSAGNIINTVAGVNITA